MPGIYSKDGFDLAGFSVGAMERGATLPRNVSKGDDRVIVMYAGEIVLEGPVRKILKEKKISYRIN